MNRIQQLFSEKKDTILSIYMTAGYPNLHDTATVIQELQKAGVDMIEIGLPYSDPLADGKTIQDSSTVALQNGITIEGVFNQLRSIRKTVSIPLLCMGYINPIYQFGFENFCKSCKEIGVDGVIIPDLPLWEYEEKYKTLFESYGISVIFLIAPQTPQERVLQIDKVSNGFIYMVSSAATTGSKMDIDNEQIAYFARISNMNLKTPRLIGFGISNNATYKKASEYADGVIIGSAFIQAIQKSDNLPDTIQSFITSIRTGK